MESFINERTLNQEIGNKRYFHKCLRGAYKAK